MSIKLIISFEAPFSIFKELYKFISGKNELFLPIVTLISKRGESMNVIRLVKRAKKGNKDALLELIMAEKAEYYRLAFTYMGNSHDAMDALEDMIVKVYEKIDQLKKDDAFYSWSKTILVNSCKELLRKQKRLVLIDNWQVIGNESVSSQPFIKNEQQIDIQEMLLHLNEHQKEAIQLKYFHDYDYKTIAMLTNTSVGTVKSRVFQGLRRLRDYYGGDEG